MTNHYNDPERQHEQSQQSDQEPFQRSSGSQPPTQSNVGTSGQPSQQSPGHQSPQGQPPQSMQGHPQGQSPQGRPPQSMQGQPPQGQSQSPQSSQGQPPQSMQQAPSQQSMQQPSQGSAPGLSRHGQSQQEQGPPQQSMQQGSPQQGQPQQGQPQQAMSSAPGQSPGQQMPSGSPPQQGGQAQQMPGPQMQPPQAMGGGGTFVSGTGAQLQSGTDRSQLQTATVEEVLQTDVVTVEEDTPIATAISKMKSEDVGSVIVIDDDQKPIGIVTDRKVALALEETPDISEQNVSELVSGEMITGSTDMNVFDAIQQLNEESIRRLPVVDEDGSLEGIITLDDIIVLLATELNSAAEVIQSQSPRL